ncbi:hypothetical protein vB_AbaM_Acibel004_125 [Acinetobacter phage vB_AbaM_Acibel004]|uniref:hypothetical protein n=1 Tax=Acinetobacter phage vB_AbaM_Acibel004 TaxID=1481186 RepID=UPI0004E84642|nr:hypothetical protein vB_AbaM_Acibel004_125 [Acinetobacter phage vB_AbaM_Acibel004]AHY26740.1 hypothetical protein vB_AbaM_Acibel004_125 [Acinetobacter phage vB_AbaM_Acibel004]
MAEYLKIVNNDGYILIDDTFQNYHFLEKVTVVGSTMKHYSTGRGGSQLEDSNGFLMVQHIFEVTSAKKPVVAYQIGKNLDAGIMAITYTEVSPNKWSIKVMCSSQYGGAVGTYGTLTMYVYGLLPEGVQPSTGAVFQVRNAKNEMIFDSGRRPMDVVQFESKLIPYSWLYPAMAKQVEIPIKGWDASRKYAIVPCSFMFDSYYQNPNFFYYTGTFAKMYDTTQGKVVLGTTQVGINNIMWAQNYPTMVSYSHAMIIIDVTGL